AEDELAQARMAIAAHYEEIGPAVRRMRQERVGDVAPGGDDALDLDLLVVAGEGLPGVVAGELVALAAPPRHDDDLRCAAPGEERHRAGNRARGAAAAVPAHHGPVELQSARLDVGHD